MRIHMSQIVCGWKTSDNENPYIEACRVLGSSGESEILILYISPNPKDTIDVNLSSNMKPAFPQNHSQNHSTLLKTFGFNHYWWQGMMNRYIYLPTAAAEPTSAGKKILKTSKKSVPLFSLFAVLVKSLDANLRIWLRLAKCRSYTSLLRNSMSQVLHRGLR